VPLVLNAENIAEGAECNICLEQFGQKFKKIREKTIRRQGDLTPGAQELVDNVVNAAD
jgi:hypothetical protein